MQSFDCVTITDSMGRMVTNVFTTSFCKIKTGEVPLHSAGFFFIPLLHKMYFRLHLL